MKSPLRIGIAGLGTVGSGVVKLLAEHGRLLSLRGGRPLKLVAVSARSKAKKRDIDLSGVRWEKDPMALAAAPDIDVVVELIGGSGGVARRLVQTALRSGKHVVTANKALLAHARLRSSRRWPRRGAASSPSRRRWRAASRSSRRCARAWSATGCAGSTASSTAPATTS